MPRSDAFYSDKICEATNALTGAEYKAMSARMAKAEDALSAALSEEQKALLREVDDSKQALMIISGNAAYKAGFLEGYAAGRVLSEKYKRLDYDD
jgi:hypothetical protein